MNILFINNNTICIEITKKDLDCLNLTTESLNGENFTLLNEKIKNDLKIDLLDKNKFSVIHLFPDTKGNCLLFFIREKAVFTYSDLDIDNICRFAKAIYKNDNIEHSDLKKNENGYFINVVFSDLCKKNDFILTEFNTVKNKSDTENEGFTTILCENAVRILSNFI